MSRSRDRHPMGKCSESRLDMPLPAELRLKLNAVAAIDGKHPTNWARDELEQRIEGRWLFIQRRVGAAGPDVDPNNVGSCGGAATPPKKSGS